MQLNKDAIIDYYKMCECDYRTFWNLDQSMAMHAGYWDDKTTSLSATAHKLEVNPIAALEVLPQFHVLRN